MREIIVDNFAGGGGASTGIEMAIGRSVDIAINHDPAAIAMHRANHPETEHYCESVWDVDPREVTGGRPVGLVWLSPDCKHFSKAKGGKPVEKGIRALAWVAVRWAATVRPRVIMLENVEEFTTWGPLTPDGYPDKKQKGRTFRTFVNALRRQGYRVEWRELRACDYGAPTIRKRLFLVARCDGRPIVWPEPTHGAPDSPEVLAGKRKPWRTAAEIIDWSIPCPSIFERSRPLAENTMRRIARGIQRFVTDNPRPFIVRVNHSGSNHHYTDSIDEPFKTVTSKNGWGLVTPTMIEIGYGEGPNQVPRVPGLNKPLGTVVAGGRKHALVSAFLARHFGNSVGSSIDDPVGTVTAGGGGHSALVTSHLVKLRGTCQDGQPVTDPMRQ
ncbi:Modification methylase BspRI [Paenibacillus sp. P1XP2]|nr:Modification methylase BspRI [Paenibacillus sp. P1XP2]